MARGLIECLKLLVDSLLALPCSPLAYTPYTRMGVVKALEEHPLT